MDGQRAQTRDVGVDAVKAAAILGVVLLHTSTDGYASSMGGFDWYASLFWGCLVRASVPLFLMCSGALLLPPEKDLPLRRLWGKNILRIVVAMCAWAVFYKVFHLLGGGAFSLAALWQGVKEVLVFDQEFHLYFLHIILLVYAFLPLTRLFVRHASAQTLRYALALWFALGILYPTVRPWWPFTLLTGVPTLWPMNMAYAAVGYGLLGWYLTRHLPKPGAAAVLTAAGFALVFVPTVVLSLRKGALEEHYLEGMGVGVCVLAAGLYSLLYRIGRKAAGSRLGAAATKLSVASFGIYLVHVVWLTVFRHVGLTVFAFPTLLSVPALAACNVALSWLCRALLARIPFVRRWLV